MPKSSRMKIKMVIIIKQINFQFKMASRGCIKKEIPFLFLPTLWPSVFPILWVCCVTLICSAKEKGIKFVIQLHSFSYVRYLDVCWYIMYGRLYISSIMNDGKFCNSSHRPWYELYSRAFANGSYWICLFTLAFVLADI